jgi:hypothetical protein
MLSQPTAAVANSLFPLDRDTCTQHRIVRITEQLGLSGGLASIGNTGRIPFAADIRRQLREYPECRCAGGRVHRAGVGRD